MDTIEAWTRFWRTGSACLPNGSDLFDALEAPVWRSAAQRAARGAKVLDLATGDGLVLATLRRLRGDLKLTGVDSAGSLPQPPRGVQLRPGTRAEDLPFADNSFDLVTSRFGAEYGDVARIARESARVLRAGGDLVWLCHHSDSRIVQHNAARREALAWASDGAGVLARAQALVTARRAMWLPTPPSFARGVDESRTRFPEQSVAAEFSLAVQQVLERRDPPARSVALLDDLAGRAAAELLRLGALKDAALDAEAAGRIAAELGDCGLAVEPVEALTSNEGAAHAWLIRARHT